MGKYMKKGKVSGEVVLMEVSPQSFLGVRTRTRTIALQRLHGEGSGGAGDVQPPRSPSSSYLQLRSRCLEKSIVPRPPKPKDGSCTSPRAKPSSMSSHGSRLRAKQPISAPAGDEEAPPQAVGGAEASFGENVVVDSGVASSRNSRETTPCSLIRDPEATRTPSSTTRPANSSNRRQQPGTATRQSVGTTPEMEEFLAGAKQSNQRTFMAKYNFDPVNDCPLPGRYEWVKLNA